jgi:hypothetical protein
MTHINAPVIYFLQKTSELLEQSNRNLRRQGGREMRGQVGQHPASVLHQMWIRVVLLAARYPGVKARSVDV